MNRKYMRAVVATLALALVALPVTGCAAVLPGGTGKCDITIDYPHGSTRVAGKIDGKGKMTCTIYKGHKITNVKIETRLQKWNGKAWATVANTTTSTPVKQMKSGTTYTGVSGFIPCQKGIFRTQARGTASLDGAKAQSTAWGTTNDNEKKGVKDPCVKPLKVVSVG